MDTLAERASPAQLARAAGEADCRSVAFTERFYRWCSGCGELLIERDWHSLGHWGLDDAGRCCSCGAGVPGRFAGPPRQAVAHPMRVRFA